MSKSLGFRTICVKNGLAISDGNLQLLIRYVDLLLEWNQKINLISRKDTENVWSRHILGSISFLFQLKFYPESTLVDIGTGGGLPGIPLLILQNDLKLLLIDSIRKKITAVQDILVRLNLGDRADAVVGRAEDLGTKKEFAGKFDYVIARGVAPMSDVIGWAKPFLKKDDASIAPAIHKRLIPKGSIIFLKGGDLTREIEKASVHHRPRFVTEQRIAFQKDDAATDLVDKKIVIVQP